MANPNNPWESETARAQAARGGADAETARLALAAKWEAKNAAAAVPLQGPTLPGQPTLAELEAKRASAAAVPAQHEPTAQDVARRAWEAERERASTRGGPAPIPRLVSNVADPNTSRAKPPATQPAPRAPVGVGGFGAAPAPYAPDFDPSDPRDPQQRLAQAQAHIMADAAAGRISPAEAQKRLAAAAKDNAAYAKWWSDLPGLEARKYALQVQGQLGAQHADQAITRAQQDEADQTQTLLQQQAADEEARGRRMAATQEEYAARRAHDEGALRRGVDELEKSNINPERWFTGPNTWRGIMGGIAMGLGAVSSAFTGRENQAKTMITDAINRDIEGQMANLANKRAVIGERGNLLQVMRGHFQDDLQAESAAKTVALDAASAKLKAMMSGTQSKVAEIGAQKIQQEIDANKELAKIQFDYAQKAQAMALQQAQANAYAAAQRAKDTEGARRGLQWQPLTPELQARMVGGTLLAPDADTARKLRETNAYAGKINSQLEALVALGERGGNLSPTDKAVATQLASSIQLGLNQGMFKAGAMDAGTQEILNKIVENPLATMNTIVGNRSEMAKLRNLQRVVNVSIQSDIDAAGGIPIVTPPGGVAMNDKGQAGPVFAYTGSTVAPMLLPGTTPQGRETNAYGYAPELDAAVTQRTQEKAPIDFSAGVAP